MIIVDTSVWIDHFRNKNRFLVDLLEHDSVLIHPFVIGELACGTLKNRAITIKLLSQLPKPKIATNSDVLEFIENWKIYSSGIGLIDAHLLTSTALQATILFTLDKPLIRVAKLCKIGIY